MKKKKRKQLTYLAVPYSATGEEAVTIRTCRFFAVTKAAAYLKVKGDIVFSPITHNHPIKFEAGTDGTVIGDKEANPYLSLDLCILKNVCKKLVVLTLEGWQESKGVELEVATASKLELEIEYLNPRFIHMNPSFPYGDLYQEF